MSYSKGELAQSALEELGVSGYDFDTSPDQLQTAIGRMDMMLAEWNIKGIRLGYPISKEENSEPGDDSNIPDWAWEAVITNLAIRLAPSYGKTVSLDTRAVAKNSFTTLCSNFSMPREMQFNSMPRGAGYKGTNNRFMSNPSDPYLDSVDDDVDLTGGPE